MPTSATPEVIDALLATARDELPDLIVLDGLGVTDDPGDYLMVGVQDPDVEGFEESATAQQSWANVGHTTRDETGNITCATLSWNGDGDQAGQKAARDGVYAALAALEVVLRSDYTLGLPTVLWVEIGTDLRLSQAQTSEGASALLVFTVHYQARI